jgi:hypothetical protein
MFGVVHDDGLVGTSRHEDLDGFVVIAIGALVERALDEPHDHPTIQLKKEGTRHPAGSVTLSHPLALPRRAAPCRAEPRHAPPQPALPSHAFASPRLAQPCRAEHRHATRELIRRLLVRYSL